MPTPKDMMLYRDSKTMSDREIALKYGFNQDSVRSRIGRVRRDLERELAETKAALAAKIAAEDNMYEPSAKEANDWDAWIAIVAMLRGLNRTVKIMEWPDLHFPDQDNQAVELALQIEDIYQPDINLFVGDTFDFDLISRFGVSHNRKRRNMFKEVRRPYTNLAARLSGNRVMFGGNHDRARIEAEADKNPAYGDNLIEDFIDLVHADGLVIWPGWYDELRIGIFVAEHGERTGESSAKTSSKDRGWTVPKSQAHAHAPSWYMGVAEIPGDDLVSTERYLVESITSPCLCNIHPHYFKDKKKSKWVNGITTVNVNLEGKDVHFQNRFFHKRKDGSYITVFGEHELIQKPLVRYW